MRLLSLAAVTGAVLCASAGAWAQQTPPASTAQATANATAPSPPAQPTPPGEGEHQTQPDATPATAAPEGSKVFMPPPSYAPPEDRAQTNEATTLGAAPGYAPPED
jgi:hypothetical protein